MTFIEIDADDWQTMCEAVCEVARRDGSWLNVAARTVAPKLRDLRPGDRLEIIGFNPERMVDGEGARLGDSRRVGGSESTADQRGAVGADDVPDDPGCVRGGSGPVDGVGGDRHGDAAADARLRRDPALAVEPLFEYAAARDGSDGWWQIFRRREGTTGAWERIATAFGESRANWLCVSFADRDREVAGV